MQQQQQQQNYNYPYSYILVGEVFVVVAYWI